MLAPWLWKLSLGNTGLLGPETGNEHPALEMDTTDRENFIQFFIQLFSWKEINPKVFYGSSFKMVDSLWCLLMWQLLNLRKQAPHQILWLLLFLWWKIAMCEKKAMTLWGINIFKIFSKKREWKRKWILRKKWIQTCLKALNLC